MALLGRNTAIGKCVIMSEVKTSQLSERIQRIRPFFAMEMLREANQLANSGKDIIHLEVGQPSFAAPSPVIRGGKTGA